MLNYPEVVVGLFILNSKREILLVRSPKWSSGKIWTVAGGHIEFKETIEQAVKREAKEELGLDVEFGRVIAVYEDIFPKVFHKKKHFIYLECEAYTKEERPQIDNKEIIEAKWWKIEEALKIPPNKTQKTVLNTIKLIYDRYRKT